MNDHVSRIRLGDKEQNARLKRLVDQLNEALRKIGRKPRDGGAS